VLAGRYRLEQRIASGGMGEVWRAFDGVLGRTVAVKCLLAWAPDEPTFVDRFHAEARTMATISHPGVVEVYDFGDDPAVGVYLVMKFIEGESLARTLARTGRLSAEVTMRLVAEAAEALHAAHGNGVIHRDVKPGNLLLRPDGSVLLTDFGIAGSAGANGHTATGSLVGTASYMAPERADGRPATARSDIYSLGVVAYRCLAGHLPFVGDSPVEVALRHVHDEPPPLPAEVPPRVREIVERAMAKDPAERWPSCAALAAEARRTLALLPTQRVGSSGSAMEPTRANGTGSPEQSPGQGPGQSYDRQAAVVPAAARHQETVLLPAGRRGARRLLVPASAVIVLAIITTVSAIVSRGGQQPRSLREEPGAVAMSPAENVVATEAAPSPGASMSAPSPSAARPKGGTGTAPPAVPTRLTATPTGSSTIRLRWSDTSADEDGFTVTDGVTERNVGANTTAYDWTGLPPATRSCFKVRAYNSHGVSAYHPTAQSEWVCATSLPGSGPAAPSALTATAPNPATIRLQWTDASGDEDGFTVINGVTSRNVGANTTAYHWDGLAPGTYMCFKIRSFHSSGVSAYYPAAQSEWVCITTPAT
jgi:serine/threonine-protein kinase